MLRLLALGLIAGCAPTTPAPAYYQPAPAPAYDPPAPVPAAAPAPKPRILTRAEIDAIPSVFPATIVKPKTAALMPIYNALVENNSAEIGEIPSKLLMLEDAHVYVPVTVEECGRERAYYDPKTREIHLCYEFLTYANELRGKKGKALATVDPVLRSIVMFSVLHEIGHALIDRLKLPIEGSEEDRADEFAYLMLTDGDDVELARSLVEAQASFFVRHGIEVGGDTDGVHSAGQTRAFDGNCILYGRLREPHAKNKVGERAEACIEWAEAIRVRWNDMLRTYSRVTSGNTFLRATDQAR